LHWHNYQLGGLGALDISSFRALEDLLLDTSIVVRQLGSVGSCVYGGGGLTEFGCAFSFFEKGKRFLGSAESAA
jgi:hypothetical protein